MASADRRQHLLAAAGGLVAARGWTGLTMQQLAEAAAVSRQLVYEHFVSLDELRIALLVHLFEPIYAATGAITRSPRDVHEVLRDAYALVLALPAEQRVLLRVLVNGETAGAPDLGALRQTLRRRVASLWTPLVTSETGLRGGEARSLAWAVIVAGFALADLVESRELGRKAASDLFVRIAEAALAGSRTASR
ncbi:MAG: hypothetical protein DCC71_23790 [Proteobacteria bacterium]|nr:MAG: hypothetical protein DCC71_23790 [Pseudomonadota bacterium]